MGFSRGYHHPHTCHGMPSLRREIWQWTAAGLPNFGVVSWDGPWCHVSMWWWLARHFEVVVETITESSICMYIYIYMWNMERKEGPGPRRGNTWLPWRAFQGDSEDDAQSGAPDVDWKWRDSKWCPHPRQLQDYFPATTIQVFWVYTQVDSSFFSMDNPYTQVDSSSLQLQSWVVYIRYNPYPVSSCCWMAHSFHDAIRGRFWALHWFKDTY